MGSYLLGCSCNAWHLLGSAPQEVFAPQVNTHVWATWYIWTGLKVMALVFPTHCIQDAPILWPFPKCDTIHQSTATCVTSTTCESSRLQLERYPVQIVVMSLAMLKVAFHSFPQSAGKLGHDKVFPKSPHTRQSYLLMSFVFNPRIWNSTVKWTQNQ